MELKIALAGNPNCGKTTLFNALTGSNQFVGNWPGVTVEKKEGKLKTDKEVIITDLPGIYSLSPYTLEEVVARKYLLNEKPDAVLNIIDGTNLERNLYLTTQIIELGIPVVAAVNMMDIVRKDGTKIDIKKLSQELGCQVVEISALKSDGVFDAADAAVKAAKEKKEIPLHKFSDKVENALSEISSSLDKVDEKQKRWYAVKLFERDAEVLKDLGFSEDRFEKCISTVEQDMDDDSESIITTQRYERIEKIVSKCYNNKNKGGLTVSDKIDRIVTNRILALPIFAAVMIIVYYVSVYSVGTIATDWANDGVFGDGWYLLGIGREAYTEASEPYDEAQAVIESFESAAEEQGIDVSELDEVTVSGEFDDEGNLVDETYTKEDYEAALTVEEPSEPSEYGLWIPGIPVLAESILEKVNCADWLSGLILDGIIGGVGAVLGFVPQMFVLFLFLAFLEACGYMARVAFVMDRIFRRFGLSGKSFIPILIGTGCGVPGIMASRTIENENDRRMTIMTTTFIPCGAKLPIIALIAAALLGGAWWVAPSAYFVGIAAIIISGVMLKKTRAFAGKPAPFVMELPAYHMPTVGNVLRSMWERGWSFIKKAGTIILLSSIILWFLQGFGVENGKFTMVEDLNNSVIAALGSIIAPIFAPLGWGKWQAAVAAITGLIAKENVVGTFGVLFGNSLADLQASFTPDGASIYTISAYSFLVFNLLCAPCFAAMGAIKREMNNGKWTVFAICYQCIFAYAASFVIYQLGMFFMGQGSIIGVVLAIAVIVLAVFMLVRPSYDAQRNKEKAYG